MIGRLILSLVIVAILTSCSDDKAIINNTKEIKNTTIHFNYPNIIPLPYKFETEKVEAEKIQITPSPEPIIKSDKTFTVTAYSNHVRSTGKSSGDNEYGITASGKKTREGVTIAADWRVLPKGTKVFIEGIGIRIVQDKGGAIKGNKIDLYFEDEDDAWEFGRQKLKVHIISKDGV